MTAPEFAAKNRTVILAIVGFALFSPYYSSLTLRGADSFGADVSSLLMSILTLSELVCLVLISCLHGRLDVLHRRKRLMVITAAALCVAGIGLPVIATLAPAAVVPACAMVLLDGAARAIGALAWLECFCAFNMRTNCVAFPATMILGNLYSKLVQALPPTASILLGITGCIASMVILMGPLASPVEASDASEASEQGSWSFPFKPTILMGVFSCALVCIEAINPVAHDHTALNLVAIVGVYLALIVLSRALSARFDIKAFHDAAAPLVVAGAMLSLPAFADVAWLGYFSTRIGFISFSLFTYIVFFNMSYRFGISPLWLFGFSRGVRVAVNLVVPAFSPTLLMANSEVVLGLIAIAVSVAATVFVVGEGFSTTWGARQLDTPAPIEPPELALEQRCRQEAFLKGLTRREEEVLALLAQGKATAQIEAELFISNGTARNHIQHVYKKLGVHSKAELLEHFGGKSEDDCDSPS